MISLLPSSGAHTRKRTADQTGFTLVEVLLAMILLSVATLGLVQLAGAAVLTSRSALSATAVGVHAENSLEAARDRGWVGNVPGTVTDTLTIRGVRYARRVTVAERNIRTREIRVDISKVAGGRMAYTALTFVVR